MKQFRHQRMLCTFNLALICFLAFSSFLIARQQRNLLYETTYQNAVQNLDLMAEASLEALLKSDYVTVRTLVMRWGEAHHEIHNIRVIAPNGFLIAEYLNAAPQSKDTYALSKNVNIENLTAAVIHFVGDYHTANGIYRVLWTRLVLAALIITTALGFVLWAIFRKMAIAPLEEMVEERTRSLSTANVELEQEMAERISAQEELRASEEKYRRLFEESQDMVFFSSNTGTLTDINPSGVSRLGYSSKEELLNLDCRDIYASPEDLKRLLELLDSGGFATDLETAMVCRNRQLLHVSINATAIRDELGRVAGIRGFVRDITEHRKLEDQLRQSQKMESIGTLAGGIAHDFNNILSAIIGYGQLTMMHLAKDDPNRLNLEQIMEAADRATRLSQDLLLFSRKQPIERRQTDLNETIEKTRKFLIRVIGEDIELKTRLYEGKIPILADAHQIQQVLMNLSVNARDAMQNKGGLLTITSELVARDSHSYMFQEVGSHSSYALLMVSDTGEGMDEQTSQKIFEPFFTTKETGKGTGLGLSVVYGIVKQHEGQINVYSEPGIGTTFKIYLPVIASGAVDENMPLIEEQPVYGNETILLAEDNEAVRNMTTTVLKEFGYTVITAVDGEDAVTKYLDNRDSIKLLLFDLIMPNKNGKEAYDEIRKISSDVKVIFASGYSPDIVKYKASLGDDAVIVYKPVTPVDLLKKVRLMLDK